MSNTNHKKETYEEFIERATKTHEKSSDDCYTPAYIYDLISDYVVEKYQQDPQVFVRPFYPGGDYEKFNYAEDCVVVDNPPFSIFSKIIRFYHAHNVKYFLFAPALTILGSTPELLNDKTIILQKEHIIYANGAKVATAFVTNLDDDYAIRSDIDLGNRIEESQEHYKKKKSATPIPENWYKSADIIKEARAGRELKFKKGEWELINKNPEGKAIFGKAIKPKED